MTSEALGLEHGGPSHSGYTGNSESARFNRVGATLDVPGVRMVRIAIRPTRVGVLDFQTRLTGEVTMEEFQRRGRVAE